MKIFENITKEELIKEITLLKAKHKELEKNKEIFQIIAENTSDNIAITTFDLKAKYLYVSPSVKNILGFDPEDLLGKSFFDFIHPKDKKVLIPLVKKYIKLIAKKILRIDDPKITETIEFRFKDKVGNWLYMQSTLNFIGKNLLAITRDITVRKHQEALIASQLRLSEFSATHSVNELLQAFLDEAEKLTTSKIGFFHFLEDDQINLRLQAWSTNTLEKICTAEVKSRHYTINDAGVWVDCVHKHSPVIHNDYASLPHKKGMPEDHVPIIRELVVPIIRNKKIKAILGVGNKDNNYEESDINTVSVLADMAWDLVERKRAEEALIESESKFKGILSSMIDMVFVFDTEGRFTFYHAPDTKSLYTQPELFLGKKPADVLPPHINDLFEQAFARNKSGKIADIEYDIDLPDGKHWFSMKFSPILKEGSFNGAVGIAREISERKQAEQLLQESEERYRNFVRNASEGIYRIDFTKPIRIDLSDKKLVETISKHAIVSEVNEALAKMYGLNPEDMVGRLATDFAPEYGERAVLAVRAPRHQVTDVETMDVDKDGQTIYLSENYSAVVKDGILIRIWGMQQEISKRKRAEEALRESETNFRSFFNTIDNFLFILDEKGCIKEVNQTVIDRLGYSQDELRNQSVLFVHPEDRRKEGEQIVADMLQGKRKSCFIPLITKKGELIPVETSVNLGTWNGKPAIYGVSKDISALKQSEEKFAKAFHSNPAIAGLSNMETGKYVEVNQTFYNKLGYTPEEVIGKHSSDVIHMDIQFRDKIVAKLKEYNYVKNEEAVIYTKKGIPVDVLLSAEIITIRGKKHIFTTAVDITERKKTEQALRESEKRLKTAGKAAYDLIYEWDVENDDLEWFGDIDRMLGYKKGEISRDINAWLGLIKNEDIIKLKDAVELHRISTDPIQYEYRVKHKDGTYRYWSDHGLPLIDKNGRPYKWIGVCTDITEHKKAEETMKKLNEELAVQNEEYQVLNEELTESLSRIQRINIELEKARKHAEESDHLKSAFLANMSHEIRTPMNGILGFADLLKEPNLSGNEQQKYISIIKNSGERMLNILNDLIDISKIEAGQIEVNISEVNINELTEYLYSFFKPETEKKGIQLSFKHILPAEEAIIKTDREKIYAIITNLVKNAIKYTDQGSIEFAYEKKGSFLEFFIEDTGIGIPKERQQAIFNRFVQADIDDKRALEGAGLGLSISKAYVEMLGGRIWVESQEGKRSKFYFTIPYNTNNKEIITKKDAESTSKTEPQINNLKILIAEDEETADLHLSLMLKNIGKEILHTKTGLETVDTCRNNPDIDLVLMDIKMPELNGYEATRKIREFNKDVIIIAQTAYALISDRKKALEAGCNDYISKPINKEKLKEIIMKHVYKA